MPIAIGVDHGRWSRASAYAAGSANASVIATTRSPTTTVLITNVTNGVLSNRYLTCSSVGGSLKRNGLLSAVYRSAFCLNVVTRLHRNGVAHNSAATIASR